MNTPLNKLYTMLDQKNLSEEDVLNLSEWCLSPDDEVRILVAQVSVLSSSPAIQNLLLILAKDFNYLVRANACDSLCNFPNETVLNTLKKISRTDRSNLVKSYAILSILDMIKQLNKQRAYHDTFQYDAFYKDLSKRNSSPIVQCACSCLLYYLGNEIYLQKLCDRLASRLYTTRCFVLNSLFTIVTRDNAAYIDKQIDQLLITEQTEAVKSAAANLKQYLMELRG